MQNLIAIITLFVFAFVFVPAVSAQQPAIGQNGVLNGASYALPGLPSSGIAQGSIFVIFGQNLGPSTLVQVSQTLPQTLQWLNESSIAAVNRAQGVQVTWSAADPNGVVQIQGLATDSSNTVTGEASFASSEPALTALRCRRQSCSPCLQLEARRKEEPSC